MKLVRDFDRLVIAGVAMAISAGCLLTTSLGDLAQGTPATSPDGGIVADGGAVPDGGVATDSGGPAAEGGSACRPTTTIDTSFDGTLGDWVPSSSNAGYPKSTTIGGLPGALMAIDGQGGWASLTSKSQVPLVAFDVAFDFFFDCAAFPDCGDGLSFDWLEGSVGPAELTPLLYGGADLGVPHGMNGGAVAVDDITDAVLGDVATPAVEILHLEKPRAFPYPWVAAHLSISFARKWQHIELTVRHERVTVQFDGSAKSVEGVAGALDSGTIGLNAGSGGRTSNMAFRNFHGTFYNCIP
jgi:hypothetical protein